RQSYGVHPRFWVEPERREEFAQVSDARRAAWAWRRYVTAGRAAGPRTIQMRYEDVVVDGDAATGELARTLGVETARVRDAFAAANAGSVGRWRRELTPEQLADVEAEAGPVLAELGYGSPT